MDMETQIEQAIKKAYYTPKNSKKIIDPALIKAITKEILQNVGFIPKSDSLTNPIQRNELLQITSDTYKKEASIHSNPDAQVWAAYFMFYKYLNDWKTEDIDEALMLGWFANAMMAMHDHLYQTKKIEDHV